MGKNSSKRKSALFVLDGQKLNGFTLSLREVKPGRFIEEKNFHLYLKRRRETSLEPVIIGTYFEGRGKYFKPWLEIYYRPVAEFERERIDLPKKNLELPIFKTLSRLIPPGGRIFVIYDSKDHLLTAKALGKGVHPAVTPLGYLLWQVGFRWYKNWYFSEGWKEGSRKLQANKPLKKEHEEKEVKKLSLELKEFLSKKPLLRDKMGKICQAYAQEILREMRINPW